MNKRGFADSGQKNKKGDIELDVLGWWILGFAVLLILAIGTWYFFGKGSSAIDYLKNLLRIGR